MENGQLLTEEEHKARAMLMGAHWFEQGNYYFRNNGTGFANCDRFDADTLEPITKEEARARHLSCERDDPTD